MHIWSIGTELELQSPFIMESIPEIIPESHISSNFDEDNRIVPAEDQSLVISTRVISLADGFEKKESSCLVTSQIPTDLSIQVEDITFFVHKYPLLAKCGYIRRLELQPSTSNFGYEVKLENFPGGPETFETVLKFCYGLPLGLNPKNIAPLRCAADFLEMSDDLEDGNLIAKTEAFLTFIILSAWKDNITILKSCETLSPWAENLQIVRRCCDSIAWKASRDNTSTGDHGVDEGLWLYDVATLHVAHFMRIIATMRAKGMKPDIVGKCVMQYASRWLQITDVEFEGLRGYRHRMNELQISILSRSEEIEGVGHSEEQKTIIESLISILPLPQEAVPCKFLLKMLKMAIAYDASPALISELEKRVGMVLEEAYVQDLLILNYKNEDKGKTKSVKSTMHNIEVVQRIVEYFLMHEQEQQELQPTSGKSNVSKLLDNYLAEVARDPNLSITQFQVLAECLPKSARACDDGLYRAIDTYLKTHTSLSEHDRRRLCKIMNCGKLSIDACMHAAQNDGLPIRTVIQVLFAEQAKMRTATQATTVNNSEQDVGQKSTRTEIMGLKAELFKVKTEMEQLQRDYSELQHKYGKLNNKDKNIPGWSLPWKKIRKSALFNRNVDDDETDDAKQMDGVGRKVNNQRRQSIS